MAQHFLMSAAARTLSLVDLCDLSEDAAHKMLCEMRWEDTDGAPVCPHCSCPAVYTYRCRRVFKCKACHRQFSATSGTLLAHRKLAFRTLLMAFSLFVNAAKGLSSLQLSRNLGLHAKTAFVLLHKLRCALTSDSTATILSGVVEIDAGWFGGYIRPENYRVARIDRRRREHQNGKRLCVVVMRQRGGKTVTHVVKHEAEAVPIIRRRVARAFVTQAACCDFLAITRRTNDSISSRRPLSFIADKALAGGATACADSSMVSRASSTSLMCISSSSIRSSSRLICAFRLGDSGRPSPVLSSSSRDLPPPSHIRAVQCSIVSPFSNGV